MALFGKSRNTREEAEDDFNEEDEYLEELDEDETDDYDDAEDEDAPPSKRLKNRQDGEEKKRKTPVVAVVCVVLLLLIILFAAIIIRSRNKGIQGPMPTPAPRPVVEQTETNLQNGGPGSAPEAAEKPNPQGPGEQQRTDTPASSGSSAKPAAPETAAPKAPEAASEAAVPKAYEAVPEATPALTPAAQNWEIDKDLVVYECILDWEDQTKYHISFAEFDAAGNVGKVYTVKNIVSPSQMGADFSDTEALHFWFFPGATVHVKGNSDLSAFTVTKAS